MDKARPEVVVDIAVLQVSKDKSRTLGLSPPTSATVTLQSNLNTTTHDDVHTTRDYDEQHHRDVHRTRTEYSGQPERDRFSSVDRVANLSALMGDTDTKMLQNPQVRALDNQKATLKIGERVP